ncbi:Ankyrin repeat domain-containing protein 60 [Phytophthora pseudosyringae]|uniref:Ankyrin repeat domain-containing protein 60 n=1 Tax=Phytophthora pseudosyringae TaxID=221518 RepID=A0A8T1VAD2_9STRA|nr:Ankyrin repeat domain-containing protein 60 [Phytophthora pseudosyringae]
MTLIDAAFAGNLRAARQAITSGCSVDERGTNGYTAVMEAARLGHVDVLTFLLTSGASTDLINFEDHTALHLAVNRQQLQTVKVLFAFEANTELGDAHGQTPLMLAVKQGFVEMATVLIEASPNSVRAIDKEGDSVLGIAAYSGQFEIILLLLDCGIPLSLSNGGAPTPLMLAAAKGHVEIMKLFLDKGADVGERMWNGHTALTFAAESGQEEAVRTLLLFGAQVNSHGIDAAPLAIAAQRGHVEVVKLLLKHNANANAKDSDGDSALHETVYKRLWVDAFDGGVSMRPGRSRGPTASEECIGQQTNKDGRSALHIAAEEGRVDVTRLLVQRGTSIDVVNKAKWTPLMMAANRGHKETVKYLVQKGASLTRKNADDQNAAGVAKMNSRTDVLDLLQAEDPEVTTGIPSTKKQRTF